jgi:hypothetical protein
VSTVQRKTVPYHTHSFLIALAGHLAVPVLVVSLCAALNIRPLLLTAFVSRAFSFMAPRCHCLNFLQLFFTSDPPRLRTGAMLMLKCFSAIAFFDKWAIFNTEIIFQIGPVAPEISAFKQTNY